MKKSQNEILEDALGFETRGCGQTISKYFACEKAFHFNQKLDGVSSFKADLWMNSVV